MKNIVVTGISKGLGEALFQRVQAHGNVVGVGRRFTEEQQALGCTLIRHDFLDEDDAYLKELELSLEPSEPSVLVLNAGVVEPIKSIGMFSDGEVEAATKVNFLAPVRLVNWLVTYCKQNKQHLTIINISTGAALHPIAGWAAYCSTKAAMRMFLDVLQEQDRENVRIHHVDPGVMDTDMQTAIRTSVKEDFPRHTEFVRYKEEGRLLAPSDVATRIVQEFFL